MNQLEKAIRLIEEVSQYEASSWSNDKKVGFKYALEMAKLAIRTELEKEWAEEDAYWNQRARDEEAIKNNLHVK